MASRPLALALCLGWLCCCFGQASTADLSESQRPNFLIIVADDLGFSDLGFMGSEIATPALDRLAREGMVMTDFHVSPACSPTRAMLLTGLDAHRVGYGTMWDEAAPEQLGQPGYEGVLSADTPTIAERLSAYGYRTYLSGKWHLGSAPAQWPTERGFDHAYGPLAGGASHFADQLPLFFPGQEVPDKAAFIDDGALLTDLPDDFFSSKNFTDRLIALLEQDRSSDQPFMAFAMFTAPHWPLQVPDEWLARYRGAYDAGWDQLRTRRAQAVADRGLMNARGSLPERLPWVDPWHTLTAAQQTRAARTMELYAAMVSNLDYHIGRLLDYLDQSGLADNTYVVFFSDNGAEGNPVARIVSDHEWVERRFDNRLENMGRAGSYLYQGPGWAQASSAPLGWFKTFPGQGGIQTPALVRGPGIKAGMITHSLTHVLDIAPTVLELAQAPSAATPLLAGTSLVPLWRGQSATVRDADAVLAWELFGRRALRQGRWKILWLYEPYGPGRWQLFDLREDPGETRDLATQHPQRLAQLIAAWEDYAQEQQVILPAKDASYALEPDWR